MLKVGKKGRIISGDEQIRYVMIQDDRNNSGGYLILKGLDPDFKDGYDDWVEEDKLDAYFEESGWLIEWMEGN